MRPFLLVVATVVSAGNEVGAGSSRLIPSLAEHRFELPRGAELLATISARCDSCAWDTTGREAVSLIISIDGRYSQHLPLVRTGRAEYNVMLGAADAGRHTIRVQIDPDASGRELRHDGVASIERVTIAPVFEGEAEHAAVSLAPFVYARPNTIGRFTDVPVFMWYETEPTPRGRRYRYSMIFTNEDGGTPADRLMATWGRTTDIEYIYGVELDRGGAIIAEDFQGPEHEILQFRGRRERRHPLLWVSTDNNMVRDEGTTAVRYGPAPIAFDLRDVSRETVMDARPWLYSVMSQELAREHKIVDAAAPGSGTVSDPRRFVYIEACGEVGGAALAFGVSAGGEWIPSDRGMREYRITRNGCFRAAVPLQAGMTPRDVRALRVQAFEKPSSSGSTPTPSGPVRLARINKVFMLDEHYIPGDPLLRWEGPATLVAGGAPLEVPIK